MTNVYCIFSGTYLYEDEQRGPMQVTYLVNLINTISTVARVESYTARAIEEAMTETLGMIQTLPNEARVEEIATAIYEEGIEIYNDDLTGKLNTAFNGVVEIIDEKIADALGVIENGTY